MSLSGAWLHRGRPVICKTAVPVVRPVSSAQSRKSLNRVPRRGRWSIPRKPTAKTANHSSSVRAMACKAPRHRWHLRQPRHCGTCNLRNLKEAREFESHSLRQVSPIPPISREVPHGFAADMPVERNPGRTPPESLKRRPIRVARNRAASHNCSHPARRKL